MNRLFLIKTTLIFGMVLFFFALPISQHNIGVHDVFAQEEVIESNAEEVETSNSEKQESGFVQKVKNFFSAISGWFGKKLKFFTDKIDAAVGVESDNKGTNALFGMPLYIFVAIIGLFAFKLIFNILRDTLKAIFSGGDGKPKGRHREVSKPKGRHRR
ncbi:MAG: hypothetical protein ACQ9MH_00695 [Nitrospinales bacterium]